MRRWWTASVAAADLVAGRADLWLPGALAWSLTVGWAPLTLAVVSAPDTADLTFLGARLYSSGAWPWNAIAAGGGLLLLAISALVLVAVAETVLVGGGRRGPTVRGVARLAAIGLVTAAPTVAALLAAATAFIIVAMREFNAPGVADPVLRSLWRISPILLAIALAWVGGAAAHAAATREAVLRRAGMVEALAAVPRRLRRSGAAGILSSVAAFAASVAYLATATLLLSVLWDPIGMRLAVGGLDATVGPLLVGFVAIWLCLVLGGGALRAWSSETWTRVLEHHGARDDAAGRRTQGEPHRP